MEPQFGIEGSPHPYRKTAAVYGYYPTLFNRRTPLQDQIRVCQDFANDADMLILPQHIYTDVDGSKGTSRTGLEALKRAVQMEPKPFDYVLMDEVDRCSQRLSAIVAFTKLLKRKQIGLRFVNPKLDSADKHFNMTLEIFSPDFFMRQWIRSHATKKAQQKNNQVS